MGTGSNMTGIFLVVAVAISFGIGSLSYASGSAPEWIVLKSSVGLLLVGAIGWAAQTVAFELPAGAKGHARPEVAGPGISDTLDTPDPEDVSDVPEQTPDPSSDEEEPARG